MFFRFVKINNRIDEILDINMILNTFSLYLFRQRRQTSTNSTERYPSRGTRKWNTYRKDTQRKLRQGNKTVLLKNAFN